MFDLYLDTVSLVAFIGLSVTGIILRFAIPHRGGVGGAGQLFGNGEGQMRQFAGISRHLWTDIHFYIACAFAGMILMHLALHLGWVKAMLIKGFGTAAATASPGRGKI